MKMKSVTWKGDYYCFAYEQETASEPMPDYREVIICEMARKIDELENSPKLFTPSHDNYWLRTMATAAMQGMLTVVCIDHEELMAKHSVRLATALLAEIKKIEEER